MVSFGSISSGSGLRFCCPLKSGSLSLAAAEVLIQHGPVLDVMMDLAVSVISWVCQTTCMACWHLVLGAIDLYLYIKWPSPDTFKFPRMGIVARAVETHQIRPAVVGSLLRQVVTV